jgi:hypothetical protein
MSKITIDKQLEEYKIHIFKLNYINIIFLTIAVIVCSAGLLLNNVDYVLASSIISIIINPMIAISFLIATNNFGKLPNTLIQVCIILAITLLVSFIIGYINAEYVYVSEPTKQMEMRNNFKKNFFSIEFLIAIISGFGMYFAIMESNMMTILGFIIVFAVLPPIANTGLNYGMYFNGNPEMKDNENYLTYGNNSFILCMINLLGIIIGIASGRYVFRNLI